VTTTGRRQLHRSLTRVAAAAALAIAALTLAAPAAAQTCAEKVIVDWSDDFRVDGEYPLHCYDDAIEALPRDVRDYSSAKEDIERAMQQAMREGATPTTPPDDPTTTEPSGPDEPTDTTDGGGAGPSGGDDPGDGGPEAVPATDTTSSSDSVPLPLLVLAGLALLLLAAGSFGYVWRRVQARRVPPAPTP
jgi:hypothetical protein